MKKLLYITPKFIVTFEINNIAYWFMKKLGFKLYYKDNISELKGKQYDGVVIDEII